MKKSSQNHKINETPIILRIWVWTQIWVHVMCGVCTLSLVFPFLDRRNKHRAIQKWSKHLLRIFNIELIVQDGALLGNIPHLIAANHISWLDIHVINAFKPICFVAKSEVEGWPIFGWMAKQLGTLFIKRDSARDVRQVVNQMAEVLKADSVCIFPEGTSTAGESVLPFKPNLFETAILAQTPVFPLALQYLSKTTGNRSESPAFIGEMGLLESMSNIIKNRALEAKITILPAFPWSQQTIIPADRKQVASYCENFIAKTLEQQM
ncbi:1-acyl-sn-glycerol-3-phosphate acyltransferase [Polynucleobacter sp. 71A-WALBACH]|uniref:lysophospholipid acyltransferase family protein n=1 Tax=Polynucleobacter sp. 71A-WALBACH TaxID=2689097 RepID=UPI001C0C96BA|nr:lysophospholipid acyltransferase family protein [Polynucleobacter sp. 71A-WALBACH]MBU3593854.1 1-acyl-sn-glycerol-3-phosphate acyltransferase [Polynucleobacter sp. 71A-WALBACH]